MTNKTLKAPMDDLIASIKELSSKYTITVKNLDPTKPLKTRNTVEEAARTMAEKIKRHTQELDKTPNLNEKELNLAIDALESCAEIIKLSLALNPLESDTSKTLENKGKGILPGNFSKELSTEWGILEKKIDALKESRKEKLKEFGVMLLNGMSNLFKTLEFAIKYIPAATQDFLFGPMKRTNYSTNSGPLFQKEKEETVSRVENLQKAKTTQNPTSNKTNLQEAKEVIQKIKKEHSNPTQDGEEDSSKRP